MPTFFNSVTILHSKKLVSTLVPMYHLNRSDIFDILTDMLTLIQLWRLKGCGCTVVHYQSHQVPGECSPSVVHQVMSTKCVCRVLTECLLSVCSVQTHLVGGQYSVNTRRALGGIGGVQLFLKCKSYKWNCFGYKLIFMNGCT